MHNSGRDESLTDIFKEWCKPLFIASSFIWFLVYIAIAKEQTLEDFIEADDKRFARDFSDMINVINPPPRHDDVY